MIQDKKKKNRVMYRYRRGHCHEHWYHDSSRKITEWQDILLYFFQVTNDFDETSRSIKIATSLTIVNTKYYWKEPIERRRNDHRIDDDTLTRGQGKTVDYKAGSEDPRIRRDDSDTGRRTNTESINPRAKRRRRNTFDTHRVRQEGQFHTTLQIHEDGSLKKKPKIWDGSTTTIPDTRRLRLLLKYMEVENKQIGTMTCKRSLISIQLRIRQNLKNRSKTRWWEEIGTIFIIFR